MEGIKIVTTLLTEAKLVKKYAIIYACVILIRSAPNFDNESYISPRIGRQCAVPVVSAISASVTTMCCTMMRFKGPWKIAYQNI